MTTRRLLLRAPLALLLALAGWLTVLALVMRLGGPAPAALVVWPAEGLLGRLPATVALADAGRFGLVLRSDARASFALPNWTSSLPPLPSWRPGCESAATG